MDEGMEQIITMPDLMHIHELIELVEAEVEHIQMLERYIQVKVEMG